MKQQVIISVHGRVQGVCYRANTVEVARALQLKGWVRNCEDGSVEILVEGEEDSINSLIEWCRSGPPMAMVSSVNYDIKPYSGSYSDFKIRY